MEQKRTRFERNAPADAFLDRCIANGVPLKIDLAKIEQLKSHKHFHFVDYIGLSSWYVQAFTDIMQSVFFDGEDSRRPDRVRNIDQESDQMAIYIQSKFPMVLQSYNSVDEFKLTAFYNIASLAVGMGNRVSLEHMLILNNTTNWAENNKSNGRLDYLRKRVNNESDYDLNILKRFAEKLGLQIPELSKIEQVYEAEKVIGERFVGLTGPLLFGPVDAFKQIHESTERELQMTGYAGRISKKNLKLIQSSSSPI